MRCGAIRPASSFHDRWKRMDKQAMREEAERLIRETMEKQGAGREAGQHPHRDHLRQMRRAEPRLGGKRRDPRQVRLQAMRAQAGDAVEALRRPSFRSRTAESRRRTIAIIREGAVIQFSRTYAIWTRDGRAAYWVSHSRGRRFRAGYELTPPSQTSQTPRHSPDASATARGGFRRCRRRPTACGARRGCAARRCRGRGYRSRRRRRARS